MVTHPELALLVQRIQVGENVYAYAMMRKGQDRYDLAIVINEQTSPDDYRRAWTAIDRAREQLRRLQGDNPRDAILQLRVYAATLYRRWGYQPSEIAMQFNYDCLIHLCRAVLALHHESFGNPDVFASHAFRLLKAMRVKDNDILMFLDDGLRAIERGQTPWVLTKGPVSAKRVKYTIEQLLHEMDTSAVILTEALPTRAVPLSNLSDEDHDRAKAMADSLLTAVKRNGLDRLMKAHKRVLESGENPV